MHLVFTLHAFNILSLSYLLEMQRLMVRSSTIAPMQSAMQMKGYMRKPVVLMLPLLPSAAPRRALADSSSSSVVQRPWGITSFYFRLFYQVLQKAKENCTVIAPIFGIAAMFILVPGPYKRYSLDSSALPTETEGGALFRIVEHAGANGESKPSYLYPFGHSVPQVATERNKQVELY